MGGRRRTYIVLALVVLLLVASVWVISTKPTQQGLDLKGGTELVYEGQPTQANPEVEAEDIQRAIDIIRDRVDTLGVAEPEIARVSQTQISVGLPEVQNAQEAIDQVGTTSQLTFYDFEPNAITATPELGGHNVEPRPFNRIYEAIQAAQKQKPECFEKDGEPLCTHDGQFYLLDENTLEPVAGPANTEEDLYPLEERQPPGTVVEEIPQGYVILREEETPDDPDTEVNETETAPRGWFLMRDRPELSGDDIRNPEQQFDPTTNQPNVTFDFTDEGREAFHEVTRRIAQRGAEKAGFGVSAEQAS